ncbi:MAG: diacylglycerol kinase family protein [Candidatus Melainabacteria bacterium]|jgi:diacylglycerol kinase|nr:diacylglycerol kinase family protein [Candidatus Melainabacteria bacterium]
MKDNPEQKEEDRKIGRAQSVGQSFYFAFRGLGHAFATQRNFRIHCVAAPIAALMGLYFDIEPLAWVLLGLSICFVLFAELMNTAIEHVVDIQANYKYHAAARYAKDTAAAAVLVASFAAVICGCFIFLPKIIRALHLFG